MRHHNSVLHGVPKQVPWSVFDKLVDEHGADTGVRRLSTRSQLVALLSAQLAGAVPLREIETAMTSRSARYYHLGASEVSRSTLADANRLRSHKVFSGLFEALVAQAGRGLRKASGEAVRLIDSTGVRHSGVAAERARFSKGVRGAKAHIIYDPDAERPLYLEVTRPGSTTSPPPRPCPSSRAPPTSSISTTIITLGGPGSTRPAAASSPA